MRTRISDQPAKFAALYIEERISQMHDRPVLLLISGGSALQVLKGIDVSKLSNNTTVVLMDERFTKNVDGNNYVALTETNFFKNAQGSGIEFIATLPIENERHEQFSDRIGDAVEKYLQTHSEAFILGLFGIGEDGHTASIFPATEQDFTDAYSSEQPYVAITRPQEQYPFRISITPAFIEEKITEVVLYAVGSKKCDNILSYMHTKNFGAHEIPALIPARHPESTLFTDCEALI